MKVNKQSSRFDFSIIVIVSRIYNIYNTMAILLFSKNVRCIIYLHNSRARTKNKDQVHHFKTLTEHHK